MRAALLELGKPGGILDADDNLAAGPVNLIVDANLSVNNRNNPEHTAGTTFFGEFLDHDMSFDLTSTLGYTTAPITSQNSRTPETPWKNQSVQRGTMRRDARRFARRDCELSNSPAMQ